MLKSISSSPVDAHGQHLLFLKMPHSDKELVGIMDFPQGALSVHLQDSDPRVVEAVIPLPFLSGLSGPPVVGHPPPKEAPKTSGYGFIRGLFLNSYPHVYFFIRNSVRTPSQEHSKPHTPLGGANQPNIPNHCEPHS